jgi:vancomycin resistance protein YoaR
MAESDSDSDTECLPAARPKAPWRRRLLLLVIPIAVVAFSFGADRFRARGKVLRGVTVGGIAASGVSEETLRAQIAQVEERLSASKLAMRFDKRVFHLSPGELGFRVDVEASARQSMLAGRSGSLPRQFAWWLARWLGAESLPLRASIDDGLLDSVVSELEPVAVVDRPFAGGLEWKAGKVGVLAPKVGRRVDRAPLSELVLSVLLDGEATVVEVPLVEVTPATSTRALEAAKVRAERLVGGPIQLVTEDGLIEITFSQQQLGSALEAVVVDADSVEAEFSVAGVDKLLAPRRKGLEAPPSNARIEVDERDKSRLVPSAPGTLLSASRVAEALAQAAHAKARVGVLPLLRGAEPAITTDVLLALKITRLVSKFTTFHPCCQPRVENIHRIADLLNGVLVKPGEYFSVNAHVGPRTTKNGFVAAPTIEEGEMVDALGGGASQFATTIFNALFYGGYDIIERQPHSYYFPRYPMGIEATLSFPKPDIIFRNDTDAGMLLRCEYTDTSITVKIFGDNAGRKVRATRGGQFDIEQPPVEFLPDPELDPDREKVKESGQMGWSVIVGRIVTYPDGEKKEEKRKVIYKPRVRRVAVHPCRIPEGEPEHTGEKCPVPEAGVADDAGPPAASP